jgi:diketogulonate reductase-like aldo/keto reductase
MKMKVLKNGFSLPELGLGTAHIGGGRTPDYSHDDIAIDSFTKAIEQGYIHIDTSELYGGGHTEELICEAIKDFDRSTLTISTKVFKDNLRADDVIHSAKESLKRLNCGYIDLYSIHKPNPAIPLKETFVALDELISEGVIKNIGVSNFSKDLLEEAQSLTKNKIVTNQIEYNLFAREQSQFNALTKMESEIIPYCKEHDILIVAVCPLGRGLLLKQNDIVDTLCEKYKKSYAQIALNWLCSQENIVAITRSLNVGHLVENTGAVGWQMDTEDIEKLRLEYPSDRNIQPKEPSFLRKLFTCKR